MVIKYRYDKGNYEDMREMMTSKNWNEDFRVESIEQYWAILEESMRNVSNKHTIYIYIFIYMYRYLGFLWYYQIIYTNI